MVKSQAQKQPFVPFLVAVTLPYVFSCRGGQEVRPVLVAGEGAGRVVAQVGSRTIYASEVAEASAESGLEPRQALDKMIEEVLLSEEAAARGYLDDMAVTTLWRKALVQKLLEEEVEKRAPEEAVTIEDIKKFYVENYANQGLLLEEAWQEIRFKILKQRREGIYRSLLSSLEEKYSVEFHFHRLKALEGKR